MIEIGVNSVKNVIVNFVCGFFFKYKVYVSNFLCLLYYIFWWYMFFIRKYVLV